MHPHGQLSARITQEREDGVIINGARMLATIDVFVSNDLAELIQTVEIGTAFTAASEAEPEMTDDGVLLAKWTTLNAARNWYPLVQPED